MRFHQFKQDLSEEILDEVRMNPSSLKAFLKSPAAEGMQAGFEAELVFQGIGEPDEYDYEPDWDANESVSTWDDIRDFFLGGEGLNGRRQVDRLIEQIQDSYSDWYGEKAAEYVDENYEERADELFDDWFSDQEEDRVREALEAAEYDSEEIDKIMTAGQYSYAGAAAKQFKDEEEFNALRDVYNEYKIGAAESAREQFNEEKEEEIREELYDEFDGSGADLEDFLDDRIGGSDAYTIYNEWDGYVDWPYMTGSGGDESGYNIGSAESLASSLSSTINMPVTAASGYHSTTRKPGLWIIEPDSSLSPDDSDDMPAEIVSPPMPLPEAVKKLNEFFAWAIENDAYANKSTGFHMGLSMPYQVEGSVDFVKLALFLGDEYVLEQFGRKANGYAVAAMKKIRDHIKSGNGDQGTYAVKLMGLMKDHLTSIAKNFIPQGFGKYVSINVKPNYIEFRSAGGPDYFKDIPKLENTMLRYAQALAIASDPTAERKEYSKKLYKLLSPESGDASLDLFSRLASGAISVEDFKKQWAKTALEKEAPPGEKKATWKVYDKSTGKALPGVQYSGYTEPEALALAKQAMSPSSSWREFQDEFDNKYELRDVSTPTGRWAIYDRNTGDLIEVVTSAYRDDASRKAIEKYGDTVSYFIEPFPAANAVKKEPYKPSKRAALAQRIIDKPAQSKFNIKNKEGGIWTTFQAADLPAAQKKANAVLIQRGMNPDDYTVVEALPEWEIYSRATGNTIQKFSSESQMSAWKYAQDWATGRGLTDKQQSELSVRPAK